tara:strand:- start:9983 stop:10708 length:726 start_codon:yes stop_codon:yes gene_type:complete
MGLETGTYIDSLNSSNPTATDAVSQGDDHIRLIKSTVKATFPNLSNAVTSTHTELNLLDGVTANTTELNYVDVATLGTVEASKAVTADANKDITGVRNLTITGAFSAGSGVATIADVYPVGSIYINAAVATNPATLLGIGTWVAFGSGRVMVGINAADSDFDTVEETGGAKTHTLTISELPSHTHNRPKGWKPAPNSQDVDITGGNGVNVADNMLTDATGGGQAHSIMNPYIVVYMWKRTA